LNSLSCPNDGTGQSEDSVAANNSGGRLQSLILKNGDVQLTTAKDLPQFLIEANNAVRRGEAEKARQILSDTNLEAVRQLVEKDRSRTDVMFVVAMLFKHLNAMGKAKKWYEKIQAEPNNSQIHSSFLYYLHFLPKLDRQRLFAEHKRWGQIHAPLSLARKSFANSSGTGRKLRIGYISPDFGMHPVSYFFESLLDGHDREIVEVYGYGNVRTPSSVTERLVGKFDFYRNICGLRDEAAVEMIEENGIDILVDLAGHTTGNRLGVLAYKPAPIQVSYLGYLDTTGMEAVDYVLTNTLSNPPQSQQFYTEELFFLPGSIYCYRPAEFTPEVGPLPAEKNGFVTFGFFGNNCKINSFVIGLWSQILKATANSRMLLKFGGGNDRDVSDFYHSRFEQCGISRERIQISGWETYGSYLEQYNQVDIVLDSFPKSGGTTTCEALWMGVPVVSLVGDHQISRTGLGILSSVGLEFFTVSEPEAYVSRAVVLAGSLTSLAKIRGSMRQRIRQSNLGNAEAFAKDVESAFQKMWQRWRQK